LRTIRSAPWIALGWFWYLGTLVPVIGIVQVGKQGMADRYSYVPLVGIFVLAAWGLPPALSRLRVPRPAQIAAGLAVLACLGVVARVQVGYWKNPIALYSHALAVTSANPVMESNLGFTLMREGRNAEALAHLSRAVAEDPKYFDAVLNLGVALTNAGQFQDALRHLLAAQALLPSDGRPLFSIGNLYLQQGNIGAAVASYRRAVALQPDAADFHNNLGVALMQGGRSREATDAFRTAVRKAPAMVKAQLNLAYALELAGEQQQALVHYRTALSVDPASEQARQGVERISRTGQAPGQRDGR
jgi:Flp pilus assembly protein TadD